MIEDATQSLSHIVINGQRITSEAIYTAWVQDQVTKAYAGKEQPLSQQINTVVNARIDYGRWIIDCVCGGAMAVAVGWKVGCPNCARVYTNIVFPARKSEIELALSRRPRQGQQFWNPSESVEDLLIQNVQHGIDTIKVG